MLVRIKKHWKLSIKLWIKSSELRLSLIIKCAQDCVSSFDYR